MSQAMAVEQAAGASPFAGAEAVADYKGVVTEARAGSAVVYRAGFNKHLGLENPADVGCFCTAEEAARAYDDAVRKAGRRVVNFPRPGTDEVQAVKGEKEKVTLLRHAGKLAPPRSGPLPLDPGSVNNSLGGFCTAEEAARAYDDAARKIGRIVVNFPRPGSGEVQAVKGECHGITLARHAAAQQAAGGAGAAGSIMPPDTAPTLSKRRAAAPPLLEPPRKRVPSRGVKSPDAVKPEAPAAPPPAPYTRRPSHHIERESSLPPGFVAPVAGVKTETPAAVKPKAPVAPPPARYTRCPPHHIETAASPPPEPAPAIKTEMPPAVKPETPAAPPIPAVAASLAAAAAPPVKME